MLPCIFPAAESPGGYQSGSLHAQYSGGGAERSNGVLHQWHGGPGGQAAAGVHVVIGGPWGRDAGALHGHYHWPHWVWAFLCMYVTSVEYDVVIDYNKHSEMLIIVESGSDLLY